MRKSIISVLIMFLLIISSTIAQGDIFVRKIDNSYQIEKRDIIAIIPQLPKNIQFNKETEEKIIELYMGTIKSYVA
ncbi:MAG: hypothetical protein NTZ97_02885, partial [Candidatus Moranbacteria bacterium]|nr:hypothetical protein [Candidatus Moranbacteria bacterium]